MVSALLAVATIILLLPTFVNAAASVNLSEMTQTVMARGDHDTLEQGLARVLGLDGSRPERVLELEAEGDTTDGFDHGFEVVLDSSEMHVDVLLLRVGKMTSPKHSESYYFNLKPDGAIERATVVSAEYADGKVIRGSGHSEQVPKGTRLVKEKLKHELDFWLKGMYRKKKPAAK